MGACIPNNLYPFGISNLHFFTLCFGFFVFCDSLDQDSFEDSISMPGIASSQNTIKLESTIATMDPSPGAMIEIHGICSDHLGCCCEYHSICGMMAGLDVVFRIKLVQIKEGNYKLLLVILCD